jgi:hypothetical protein
MALQTFTAGQVLTAAQVNALQANDYNQTVSTKTDSYTLVAADKGTRVVMNKATATTITVNTSLFSAGDTLFIQNIGAGVCTITAGTATVSSAGSLALAQNAGGTLYFTSAGVAIFFASAGQAGKILQVVGNTSTTSTTVSSGTFADSGLSATITPLFASSKILVLISQTLDSFSASSDRCFSAYQALRDSTVIFSAGGTYNFGSLVDSATSGIYGFTGVFPVSVLDSPATTSATTYKTQIRTVSSTSVIAQFSSTTSSIVLLEVAA